MSPAATFASNSNNMIRKTSLVVVLSAIAVLSSITSSTCSVAAASTKSSNIKSSLPSSSSSSRNGIQSPSYYNEHDQITITKSSHQLELQHRLNQIYHHGSGAITSATRHRANRNEDEEKEYVTSFYRKKRDEHQQSQSQSRRHHQHHIHHGRHSNTNHYNHPSRIELTSSEVHNIYHSSSSSAASVRGGAVKHPHPHSQQQHHHSQQQQQGNHGGFHGRHSSVKRAANNNNNDNNNSNHNSKSHPHTHPHHQHQDVDNDDDYYQDNDIEDDASQEYYPSTTSTSTSASPSSTSSSSSSSTSSSHLLHHEGGGGGGGSLGLLRVPCSIAINSGEHRHHQSGISSVTSTGTSSGTSSAAHHHHHHHHHHLVEDQYVKQTPIAAYVDTGAQVTVISASAARRAGILHLMDRRYAGRATGVGHCKVLGRIPARHVYFILGSDSGSELYSHGEGRSSHAEGRSSQSSHGSGQVEMEGPALTVLEGTVTQGVDVLLGLDVLQDWEAEIKMGAQKSITVNKKRRERSYRSGSEREKLVIPFVNSGHSSHSHSHHRRNTPVTSHHSKARQHSNPRSSIQKITTMTTKASKLPHGSNHHSLYHDHDNNDNDGDYYDTIIDDDHHGNDQVDSIIGMDNHDQYYNNYGDIDDNYDDDNYDDAYFSPTASDVESDLDLLEQSSSGSSSSSNSISASHASSSTSAKAHHHSHSPLAMMDGDNILERNDASTSDHGNVVEGQDSEEVEEEEEEEEDDDYLQDVEEDADDLGSFDMSGL